MAENKKSFLAYCDWLETFEALPDDKAGQLAKHLFRYVNDLNPKTDDVLIKAVFANIKHTLKRDLKKYENIKEKRSEAGRISAEKRQQKVTNTTNVKSVKQKVTNTTDSVSDSVSVINNILSFLNEKTGKNFKSTTKKTQQSINARLNEGFTENDFRQVIEKKTKDWLNDSKMSEYLRPETLFGAKFESYLNSSVVNNEKGMVY